jgi:hypothetical protein
MDKKEKKEMVKEGFNSIIRATLLGLVGLEKLSDITITEMEGEFELDANRVIKIEITEKKETDK